MIKAKILAWFLTGALEKDGLRRKLVTWAAKKEIIKMLDGIREKVAGKKTYLVAASTIVGTIAGWASGSIQTADAVQLIIGAILALTVKAGIERKVDEIK